MFQAISEGKMMRVLIVGTAGNVGKAAVYTGELVKCMQVSSVLEEIKLMTQIEV